MLGRGSIQSSMRPLLALRRIIVPAVAVVLTTTSTAAADVSSPANSFTDSVGVNAHFYYGGTLYTSNFAGVKARLQEAGIKHIRDLYHVNDSGFNARVNDLAAAGIRFNFVIDRRYHGATSYAGALDSLLAGVPAAVE